MVYFIVRLGKNNIIDYKIIIINNHVNIGFRAQKYDVVTWTIPAEKVKKKMRSMITMKLYIGTISTRVHTTQTHLYTYII